MQTGNIDGLCDNSLWMHYSQESVIYGIDSENPSCGVIAFSKPQLSWLLC